MGHKRKKALQVVHPDCAGIDMGKREHYVAVDEGADERPVRRFSSFTEDLEAMASWLSSCDVEVVAMEATGVYWIPVYEVLERYDFLGAQIEQCEARMDRTLTSLASDTDLAETAAPLLGAPGRATRERGRRLALRAALSVDLTAIPTVGVETALTIAAEFGPDLSRFPSSEHFCSWLTLAPGTRISGGKALKGRTAKRVNRAGQALRLAASTARHNRSFIGACHRARLRRLDTPRAQYSSSFGCRL